MASLSICGDWRKGRSPSPPRPTPASPSPRRNWRLSSAASTRPRPASGGVTKLRRDSRYPERRAVINPVYRRHRRAPPEVDPRRGRDHGTAWRRRRTPQANRRAAGPHPSPRQDHVRSGRRPAVRRDTGPRDGDGRSLLLAWRWGDFFRRRILRPLGPPVRCLVRLVVVKGHFFSGSFFTARGSSSFTNATNFGCVRMPSKSLSCLV